MFLSLQAEGNLVHPLNYSVALQFNQNISQTVWLVVINIRGSESISKEQASFDSGYVM